MKRDRQINIRFREEIAEKLDNYCDERGENKSTLIRRLVLKELAEHSYINKKQRRSLWRSDTDG
ncbi:MAG: ribbon-helix-helix protein, CopG family [Elusimicrobiota bacterium]